MKKMIITGLLLIIVGVGIGGVYVVMNKDAFFKSGLESLLAMVLKVEVTIGDLKTDLAAGKVDIYNLTIGNPKNYKSSEAISFAKATVAVDAASSAGGTPHITLLDITEPSLTIEQADRVWNFNQLIENAAAFEAEYAAAPTDEAQEDMPLIMDRVRIAESAVVVHAPLLPNPAKFNLPTIELSGLGTTSQPTTVAAAIETVFKKILKESILSGKAFMPEGIFEPLEGGVEALKEVGESVKGSVGDLQESLTSGEAGDIQGTAEEATENIKKGVRGLFNKK